MQRRWQLSRPMILCDEMLWMTSKSGSELLYAS